MKILVLDIETSPAIAAVWGIHKQTLGAHQILARSRVLCFAAKWLGKRSTEVWTEYDDGFEMLDRLHELLDEADAVIHYNGTSFDIPRINRGFLLAGYDPPTPYAQIDLWRTVRSQFKFMSNKLDEVCKELGIGEKFGHEGMPLWIKCLADDEAAWKRMAKYNKRDVVITEKLYFKLLPWIKTHPNVALLQNVEHACPRCGSSDLERRGFARTQVSTFQQWQCRDCKSYSRSARRTLPVNRSV